VFRELSENMKFSVIRGNISEIKAVANGKGITKGVDADEADRVTEDNLKETVKAAKRLSRELKSVIVISGPIDIVANKDRAYVIRSGNPIMAKVTGTGCMSTALIGAFCGGNPDNIEAAAFEKMKKFEGGTMMFRMFLIDSVSNMTPEIINGEMNIEEI
jgi:hydroxyethylthiazole kinase